MKTVLLKFAGPLQSWGTDSHFEIRHTDRHPSRSAVIGLIASSLGYRRGEDDAIQALNRVQFAVRVDQPGHVISDYQTAHKYKYNPDPVLERTYVTHREYLEDAVFVAAVGSDDEQQIEDISSALQNPYFQPFEGKRCCPLTADSFLGCIDADVLTALEQTPWQAGEWYQKRNMRSTEPGKDAEESENGIRCQVYADAELVPDYAMYALRRDVPISFSMEQRRFQLREEGRIDMFVKCTCTTVKRAVEHDAFSAL